MHNILWPLQTATGEQRNSSANKIYDYFVYSDEILRGFYRDDLLSEELLEAYNLQYLVMGKMVDTESVYYFPEESVYNRDSLIRHVNKLWQNPVKVVTVKVERSVQRAQNSNGVQFDLNSNEARDNALRTYSPEGAHTLCYCQMCHSIKPYRLIEVNNIQLHPTYFFPQMRIALCLECSKKFEYLRYNDSIRKRFLNDIRMRNVGLEGKIDISIGNEDKITFTGKHLAEIQEILKNIPDSEIE